LGGHEHRDRFGNPDDLQEYLRKLDDPARDEWQKPDEVLRALQLPPDSVVGEIGAGSGYFTVRIAPLAAHVFASEAAPQMLEVLRQRLAAAAIRNVTPVLGLAEDPFLPSGRCDVIVSVNAYHHFPEPTAFLRRIRRALRPGGRIAIVDFHEKVPKEQVLAEAQAAALQMAAEHAFLPQQHFLIFS
jgi:SAM-dependent methyltransferase